jgi:hypothetical protein
MTGKYPRKNWPSEFLKRHEDEPKKPTIWMRRALCLEFSQKPRDTLLA